MTPRCTLASERDQPVTRWKSSRCEILVPRRMLSALLGLKRWHVQTHVHSRITHINPLCNLCYSFLWGQSRNYFLGNSSR